MWSRALVSRVFYFWLLSFFVFSSVLASPLERASSALLVPSNRISRRGYVLRPDTVTGQPEAIDPVAKAPIQQGPATDGGGSGLDAPAIIWIVFTLAVGIPLSVVGFRGWRLTTGIGLGLAVAVCPWAGFINTTNANGISDILLTLFTIGFFAIGFLLGIFEIGRIAGMALLGVTGGLSVGLRIVLLRTGLLFPLDGQGKGGGFIGMWIIIAALGLGGGLWVAWEKHQRSGLLFACAANGTYLTALGVDLILNKQSGMGRGLIFLFDRNSSHIVDNVTKGYRPTVSTLITIGISLGLIPVLAFAQHRLFKAPFDRRPTHTTSIIGGGDSEIDGQDHISPTNNSTVGLLGHRPPQMRSTNLLSGVWDGALSRISPNRFSV